MLTPKQQELLNFIHNRLEESGVSPSFEEMKDALDLRSKSGIHRLINALEERGFIRRLPNRARALEVIRLPESAAGAAPRGRFQPRVVEGKPAGDCIDCLQCVYVCPTGVDIRGGSNLGCIQCGLCIDACDSIMQKLGRPAGLIGYDTDLNIRARELGQPEARRILRPRTVIYAALIAALGSSGGDRVGSDAVADDDERPRSRLRRGRGRGRRRSPARDAAPGAGRPGNAAGRPLRPRPLPRGFDGPSDRQPAQGHAGAGG